MPFEPFDEPPCFGGSFEVSSRQTTGQSGSDSQHVLHGGYECAVGLRRNDPLLFEMGLKDIFLSVRPIVLSLARSLKIAYPICRNLFQEFAVSLPRTLRSICIAFEPPA